MKSHQIEGDESEAKAFLARTSSDSWDEEALGTGMNSGVNEAAGPLQVRDMKTWEASGTSTMRARRLSREIGEVDKTIVPLPHSHKTSRSEKYQLLDNALCEDESLVNMSDFSLAESEGEQNQRREGWRMSEEGWRRSTRGQNDNPK